MNSRWGKASATLVLLAASLQRPIMFRPIRPQRAMRHPFARMSPEEIVSIHDAVRAKSRRKRYLQRRARQVTRFAQGSRSVGLQPLRRD